MQGRKRPDGPVETATEMTNRRIVPPGRGSHRSLLGMNSATIRASNRSAVFEAIRHYAPISRKALAEHSGLNPATVTHIVDELLAAGLVIEGAAASGSQNQNDAR